MALRWETNSPRRKLIDPVHQLGEILLRILADVVHGLLNAEFFQTVGDLHGNHSFFLHIHDTTRRKNLQ
jgi:hypothetical protein